MDNQNVQSEIQLEKQIIKNVLLTNLESNGNDAKLKIINAADGDKKAEATMKRELNRMLNHYSWMITK